MNHREIYKKHYGSIPFDEKGRPFDIHHIDGNHDNNSPENLKAVSVQEHYDIHFSQKDWGACWLIANQRLNKTKQELDQLAKLIGDNPNHPMKVLSKNGNHHWSGDGNYQRNIQKNRYKENRHPSQISSANKTHHWYKESYRKKINELHKIMLENGTHNMIQIHTCPYCMKSGKGSVMFRHHFTNCKLFAN